MPALDVTEFTALLLVLATSILVQGLMGFGFGIVAMTLLPLLLGLKDAVTLLALLNAVMMMLSLHWQKRAFRWHDARFLIWGALAGVPLGALMVGVLSEQVLLVILGVTMVGVSLDHFLRRHPAGKARQPKLEFPLGIGSGILAAGFNMGGPPVVAYAFSRNWTGEQAKAVLASIFVVSGISRLFFIGLTGVNLSKVLWLAALLLVPTALVLRVGIALGRRLPHALLRPVVFAYLGAMGVFYLFRS
jgi:uncharacterized membrane protein YfcA